MTPEEIIKNFMKSDTEKAAEIIRKYPKQIPIPVIADWWGCGEDSLRMALEEHGKFGVSWRKAGKLNRGFVVPTGAFMRWYLQMNA